MQLLRNWRVMGSRKMEPRAASREPGAWSLEQGMGDGGMAHAERLELRPGRRHFPYETRWMAIGSSAKPVLVLVTPAKSAGSRALTGVTQTSLPLSVYGGNPAALVSPM